MASEDLIEEYNRMEPSPDRKPGKIPPVTPYTRTDIKGVPAVIVGYHPAKPRMRIEVDRKSTPAAGVPDLVCDYDPTEFTEEHNMDWAVVPITGKGLTPIAFKTVHPRVWSMRLFFNTLGDNAKARLPGQENTVRDALEVLRRMANPMYYNGSMTTEASGTERPPTLIVYLTDKWFRCVITKMSVTTKAIHPTGRFPTRAEVDISFTECGEGSI